MSSPGAPRRVPERKQILVIDDAESIRAYLRSLLPLLGYDVLLAETGAHALERLEGGARPDAILLDVMMPDMDGLETLRRIHRIAPNLPVIMLSVVRKAATVVEAMKLGAADYLDKPFEEAELEAALDRVLDTGAEVMKEGLPGSPRARGQSLWASEQMRCIREILEQIGDACVTVLIHGESGVGKEVVARAVHELSTRRASRFVKVNCAALPEELLESELFGYERGAFTGATTRKIGKFEVASGGTMFLDEIGEMSPKLQAKLLQVLQDGEFSRLGGHAEVCVDVRVVAATNRNLDDMVRKGTFREDLYYRLNVVNVRVPPLRERPEEIPVLTDHFLAMYSREYGRELIPLSDRLRQGFAEYAWPGNVRELENMVKRIVVLQREDGIAQEIFGSARPGAPGPLDEDVELELDPTEEGVSLRDIGKRAAREAERRALRRVLYQTNWNRKKAARILEVSYKTLLQKIKACGLAE
ncbi:MAG: sigma-54 dependent transcriptional regulator [Myxococcota bacterium]